MAVPVVTVRAVERGEVELVDPEPGVMILGEPVTQVTGQQEGLVAVAALGVIGDAKQRATLIRMLKARMKGPERGSQRPTNPRSHIDDRATMSAGGQARFSPRNGPPAGRPETKGSPLDNLARVTTTDLRRLVLGRKRCCAGTPNPGDAGKSAGRRRCLRAIRLCLACGGTGCGTRRSRNRRPWGRCGSWPVTAADPAKRAGGADYAGHRSRCGSADRITSWQPYRSSSGAPSMPGISSRTRESAPGT